MKGSLLHGVGILFVSLVLSLALLPAAGAQDEWTFMVYMDGDNNLEPAAIDDFLEISSEGSSATVNVLALFDRIAGESTSYDDWTNTRRGIINNGDVPDSGWGVSMGELNMGDPQTVIDFAEWGMQNYPANKYCFVFWNHGGGWRTPPEEEGKPYKAVCWDDTSAGNCLVMSEVRTALSTIETDVEEIDLIGFDACLMAMVEVAYEIRDHADYMVGSEKGEPNDGWPYDLIIPDLTAAPTMSAYSLGNVIVNRYYQSYGNSEIMSNVNLVSSRHATLASRIDYLANRLRNRWNADRYICGAAAYGVIEAIEDVVEHEQHGSSWAGSHGLAIYFPKTGLVFNADYNDTVILFPGVTEWEEFLSDFYATMGGTWVETSRLNTQVYDCSSAAGMQDYHVDLYDFCLKIIGQLPNDLWVDFYHTGTELGTFDYPYNTLAEAVASASSGQTIMIKSSSTTETITISGTKSLRIMACGGAATMGL